VAGKVDEGRSSSTTGSKSDDSSKPEVVTTTALTGEDKGREAEALQDIARLQASDDLIYRKYRYIVFCVFDAYSVYSTMCPSVVCLSRMYCA